MASLEFEQAVYQTHGLGLIAGIDEAGRGAIAGPVFAAAVILALDKPQQIESLKSVNDSKQVSPANREALYETILANALAIGVGCSSAEEIDEVGIIAANFRAMQRALAQLSPMPEFLLIDGPLKLRGVAIPQQPIVRGDSKSLSIAAASILAKVSRDRFMVAQDKQYPGYHFAAHKGYCTPGHRAALEQLGPCVIHRHSFAPIRNTLL